MRARRRFWMWSLSGLLLFAGAFTPGAVAGQVEAAAEPEARTLTLQEALRLAVDGNRDLRRSRLAVDEAEGQVSEAWGSVYPRVELSTRYSRNLSPPATFLPAILFDPDAAPDELIRLQFGADNLWTNSVTLEQPIFQAQAFIAVGAASRYQALQEETHRGVSHEVVTRVRMLYYDLLLVQEQARLIERSVERVLESLEETRALERAGLVSDFDVLRLEVELANLEPQLRRAVNDARRTERELVTELDLPEGTRVEVAGSLARMDLDDPGANEPANREILDLTGVRVPEEAQEEEMESLFRRARVASPTLQQAEMNVDLRRTEVRLEQAEYLPRLSLFANYDIQAQQDGSPNFFGSSGQRGYGRIVGLQFTIPVFTGFQRGARVEQKQAALRGAVLERELTEDRTRARIRSLLEEVEEARLRTRGQRLAVEQAERGYEIASAQFREGTGSRLELTDAEVALRQSEFNYAEAIYDYLAAQARLDEAVGDMPVVGTVAGGADR